MRKKNMRNTFKQDFESILKLITESRTRAYSKANSELVLLYFAVGEAVSNRVNTGVWGDGSVQQLADFIQSKAPTLSGFNRRGLYRMKQFFETYSDSQFTSTAIDLLQTAENQSKEIVSALSTQLEKDNEVVEYAMARNVSPAIVAEYETKLIDKKILIQKLHQLGAILNKTDEEKDFE